MGLAEYYIGNLISLDNERNTSDLPLPIYGINKNKDFMPTVADTTGLDKSKYKVVVKGRFVFSGMQTGRDKCIRIGMYNNDFSAVVSPAYTTFEVTSNAVLPEYFFMIFRSSEMDRYGAFLSDGSIRANLDWNVFCKMKLRLPSIETQQKYVNIYNAMLRNQEVCSKELNDLKIVCAACIDKCKAEFSTKPVGALLEEVDVRNKQNQCDIAYGVNIEKRFIESVLTSADISNYKIVNKGQFVYSSMQTGRDKSVRLALYNGNNPIAVSPAYSVLQLKIDSVLAEYIQLWFLRSETDRRGWFMSDGSVRANLDLPRLYEIEVPIPDMEVQRSIVDFYNAYNKLQKISEKVQERIQSICPALIRGAIQEGVNG